MRELVLPDVGRRGGSGSVRPGRGRRRQGRGATRGRSGRGPGPARRRMPHVGDWAWGKTFVWESFQLKYFISHLASGQRPKNNFSNQTADENLKK